MRAAFIGLTLMDALLLWAIIRTQGWWVPKVITMVVVLAFNFAVWASSGSFAGWPTEGDIPSGSTFVGCLVQEPDRSSAGAIFLWVLPKSPRSVNPLNYHSSTYEPRAYQLPYTRDLHTQCARAQKMASNGDAVGVGKPKLGRKSGRGRVIPRSAVRLYKFPPTHPPPKG